MSVEPVTKLLGYARFEEHHGFKVRVTRIFETEDEARTAQRATIYYTPNTEDYTNTPYVVLSVHFPQSLPWQEGILPDHPVVWKGSPQQALLGALDIAREKAIEFRKAAGR